MGSVEKRLNVSALAQGVAWDTEIDVNGAGKGLYVKNAGAPKPNVQMLDDDQPTAWDKNLDVGNVNPSDFPLDVDYRWDGLENLLLALFMGVAAAPEQHFKVTTSNQKIDFDEAGETPPELTATVAAGSYTGAALATAIAAALNAVATITLTYSCAYDSATGKFTISATGNFTIRWNTGTHKTTDISTLTGFADAADDSGDDSYTSDIVGTGGSTVYLHSLTLAERAAGLFGSYATEKHSKVHVVPSLKVMKASFGLDSGLIKASFGVRGSQVIDDSAVVTAMSSVTIPTNAHLRAKFSQAVFRLNGQSGDALASGDVVVAKSFGFDGERKFDAEHGSGSRVIIEPLENGRPSFKLVLDFSRMDDVNAAYFADWIAGAEKKADITITGPAIEGALTYQLIFEFPRLIIEDVEYADAGIIPAKVTLRAAEADSVPTGMTGLTKPFRAYLRNTRATAYLA